MTDAIQMLPRYLRFTFPMQRGDDVLQLQRRLCAVDPEGAGREIGEVDGLFGPATHRGVVAFQTRMRMRLTPPLDIDGVVGPATWTVMWVLAPEGGGGVTPTSSPAELGAAVARSAAARGPAAILGQSLDRLQSLHAVFSGGSRWKLGSKGIEIEGRPLLGVGKRRTAVENAFRFFGGELRSAAVASGVPLELLVATACAETLGDTGRYGTRDKAAEAVRQEPGYVDDRTTPGRVSVGLMQTLISTAQSMIPRREMVLTRALLFRPEISIRAAAAYIASKAPATRLDPPVVACAYNAGGVYEQTGAANYWRMRQYPIGGPDHAERFVTFFNHCFALFEADPTLLGDASVPSFFRSLNEGGTADAADPHALTAAQMQELLQGAGLFAGPVDGAEGKSFTEAIEACFAREVAAGTLAAGWQGWTDSRRRLAVEQALLRDKHIDVGEIDGLLGPQTMFARESFQEIRQTGGPLLIPSRDEVPAQPIPAAGPATVWPRQSECEAFYGPVGQNQTVLVLPYRMRLAWEPSAEINRFKCHTKVHDAFLRVFTQTLAQYGEERIRALRLDLFGGCLNVRTMRGGTQRSMHSWGIAVDMDPEHNALRMTRDNAAFAREEYEPFWRIVESEGLVSLGRTRNYDWMHFQAARL